MGYKVLLPTAGTGSRLGNMTKYLNKSLISIANKPALARIIDMFPEDTEFVIATGYKADLVKEFISLAYPGRKFYFTKVDPYEGENSGLGLSILTCEPYLQEPFVFCCCDTLVLERVPAPDCNWMGYGHREDLEPYRTLECVKDQVVSIHEKLYLGKNIYPYIGLAGIYDYKKFWKAMHNGINVSMFEGEVYGLKAVLDDGIKAYEFDWLDTGIQSELEKTRAYFKLPENPNILEKPDEAIWFMDNQVIKFSDNVQFISDRVKRARLLDGFVPIINGQTKHMYSYHYVEGKVISKCATLPIFKKLLDFSEQFWILATLDKNKKEKFYKDCMKFYKKKTYERVDLFYKNFEKNDRTESINDISMPTLQAMLDSLDWDWIAEGCPGRFHGDYHFENILYDKGKDNFVFLDWRQNFGSSVEVGDIYYDLAKMLHGLIISHEVIAKNEYKVKWEENSIYYDFRRKQSLVDCEHYFYEWLERKKYDVKKVKLMTALIFLNIAALHHYPYGLLLYALGKKMLYQCTHHGMICSK